MLEWFFIYYRVGDWSVRWKCQCSLRITKKNIPFLLKGSVDTDSTTNTFLKISMFFPRYSLDEIEINISAFPFPFPLSPYYTCRWLVHRPSFSTYPPNFRSFFQRGNEETKIVTTISDKLITIAQLQLTITKLFYINDYSIIEARYYIIQNIFANILFKHRGTRYVPFHEFSMKQGFIRVKGSFEQSTPLPPPVEDRGR